MAGDPAAGQVGEGGSAVVGQRAEEGVDALLVTGAGQPAGGVGDDVPAVGGDLVSSPVWQATPPWMIDPASSRPTT